MKNNLWLVLSAALYAGCQHAQPIPTRAPAAQPVVSTPAPVGARLPERVQAYTVGAYVDPHDPAVRHAPHAIHRIEAAGQWSLFPAVAESEPLAVSSVLPTPTDETAIPVPPALPPPPASLLVSAPTTTPTAIAPVVVAPLPPPVAPSALMPNADGIIDLAALANSPDDDTNPFAVRVRAPNAIREVSLRVRGVIGGAAPVALINDRAVLVGESIESLTLERAEPDAALFRANGKLIRLPVSELPVRIRLTL